jgi:hypothetical protein
VDLVREVSTKLGVDDERATRGLGALFVAIRMAVDAKTFSEVAQALPEAADLMQHAPFEGTRTGEMLALATPPAVRRLLQTAGFKPEQVPELCRIVGKVVRDAVDADVWAAIERRLPMFN